MSPDFPYQLVAFLDKTPQVGEGVYQGERGWYPQLTLKRRFVLDNATNEDVVAKVREFFTQVQPITIAVGELTKPERMPVHVLPVQNDARLRALHMDLIEFMGDELRSRYPERDGVNYLPHITAEYDGKFVINVDAYQNKAFTISTVCVIKDGEDGDSHVLAYIPLAGA